MSASNEDEERAALLRRINQLVHFSADWLATRSDEQLRSLIAGCEAQLAEYAALGFIDASASPKLT